MNAFPSTMWSLVRGAGGGEDRSVQEFVARYRAPIVAYCRHRGFTEDAEDLAQEVLMRLFRPGVLLGTDPSRGSFRALLLAITRNVIGSHVERAVARKRGAGRVVPIGDADPAAPGRDDDFDREWMANLLERALARLAAELPAYHEALRLTLLDGLSHIEVARVLGCGVGDVKNRVFRGKRKLLEYIRDHVREYAMSPSEYEEELQNLARLLP